MATDKELEIAEVTAQMELTTARYNRIQARLQARLDLLHSPEGA